MDIGTIYRIYRHLSPHWFTVKGLLAFLAVEAVVVMAFGASAGAQAGAGLHVWGITVAACWVLTGIAWYWSRRLPGFAAGDVGILYSLHPSWTDPQAEGAIEQLVGRVTVDSRTRALADTIKIRRLPPNRAIRDVPGAHSLLSESGAILAVWGPVHSGRRAGRQIVELPKVNFSVRHRAMRLPQHIAFARDLALALPGRTWVIEEQNDAVDAAVVAGNLAEVAAYNLGLALTASGHGARAIPVLEEMLAQAYGMRDSETQAAFVEKAKRVLFVAYAQAHAGRWPSFCDRSDQGKVYLSSMVAGRMTQLVPSEPAGYEGLAICQFLAGNPDAARHYSALAKARSPSKSANYYYSAAFLDFWEGKVARGVQQYRRAFRRAVSDDTLMRVVRWIQEVLGEEPDRWQLHLALAMINEAKLDTRVAQEEYQLFVDAADRAGLYPREVQRAREALAKLRAAGNGHEAAEVAAKA